MKMSDLIESKGYNNTYNNGFCSYIVIISVLQRKQETLQEGHLMTISLLVWQEPNDINNFHSNQ